MLREIKIAINMQQSVYIRLTDGEAIQGVPESISDRVKIRQDQGTVWIPISDIDHVSRIVPLRKKDPTST
ncbi:hypothetical protein AWU65_20470 [Paenibacillus glucanolyticus]|uniref:Uncharacterized protein n=1 Tax=Paenibacillus glucanolyticus TaxID=59843 RepID=A0A163LHH4_9BACL|nr:hypothetical protein AWU65_20470 [Paenibacillus glucanolyticus]